MGKEAMIVVSRPAGEDLSAAQYKFVKIDANGAVVLATAAGERIFGVLQNKPTPAGEAARVCVFGETPVYFGASVAPPGMVKTSAAGKAVAAAATSVTGDVKTDDAGVALDPLLGGAVVGSYVLGTVLDNGGADNVLGSMFFNPMGAVPTTAA